MQHTELSLDAQILDQVLDEDIEKEIEETSKWKGELQKRIGDIQLADLAGKLKTMKGLFLQWQGLNRPRSRVKAKITRSK